MQSCSRSQFVIPIFYGLPIAENGEAWERGEVFLAGYLIGEDDPIHFCKQCLIKFDEEGKVTELTEDEKWHWEREGKGVSDIN